MEPRKQENGIISRVADEEVIEENDTVTKLKLSDELQEESDVDECESMQTIPKVEENVQKSEENLPVDKRTSSLDEIHLVSEISDTHTEKKEPNGTSYFIEEPRTPSPPQDGEAKVLAFLDDVIETEDTSPINERKNSMDSVAENEVIEKSTVAVIHQEDILKEEEEIECAEEDAGESIKPHEEIAEKYTEENENETNVRSENDKFSAIVKVNTLPRRNRDDESSMKQSKSEVDMRALLMRELQLRNPPQDEPEIPPVDYEARDSVSEVRKLPHSVSVDSSIPKAPIFDPVLYNATTKRSPRLNIPRPKVKSISPMASGPTSPRPSILAEHPTEDKSQSEEEPDENNNGNKFAGIKGKLEEILRRGPPLPFSRPRSKPPEQIPATPPQTPFADHKEPVFTPPPVTNPSKPFDTVHKQKILFSDVLKSIHPDTRPSVIRSESLNRRSATLENPVVLPGSPPERVTLTH